MSAKVGGFKDMSANRSVSETFCNRSRIMISVKGAFRERYVAIQKNDAI